MVHVVVNKYDFDKNQHFRVRFWGGGHQKAYAVYAFINVDNCERPLNYQRICIVLKLQAFSRDLNSFLSMFTTLFLGNAK